MTTTHKSPFQSVQTKEEDDELIKDRRPLSWGRSPSLIISSSSSSSSSSSGNSVAPPPAQRNNAAGGGLVVQAPQRYRSGRIEIISTGGGRPELQRERGGSVIHIDLTVRGRNNREQGWKFMS